MKRVSVPLTMFAVLLCLSLVGLHAASQSWTGWITDERCGAKGASAAHKPCALKCVGKGAKLVFYNNADKKLYRLDNQSLAKEHLGHEVTVTGELGGDAIAVTSITP